MIVVNYEGKTVEVREIWGSVEQIVSKAFDQARWALPLKWSFIVIPGRDPHSLIDDLEPDSYVFAGDVIEVREEIPS